MATRRLPANAKMSRDPRGLALSSCGTAVDPLGPVPASSYRTHRSRVARSTRHSAADDSEATLDRVQVAAGWRRNHRGQALKEIASECATIRWSEDILRLLVEELQIEDDFTTVLGDPSGIPVARYPQAIAVAIALRHSWRADSLEEIAERIRDLKRRCTPRRPRQAAVRRR